MKFLALLPILLIAQNAFADNRTKICQYFYKNDIFTGYLNLSLVKNIDNSLTLWMDTPTPYGIRPYTYEVGFKTCTPERSLHVEARSTGTTQQVIFNSKNSNQTGKLEYLNDKNETSVELIMECSPEKINEFCL